MPGSREKLCSLGAFTRPIQTLQSMAVFGNYGGRNPELHVLAQRADDVYDPIFTAEDVPPPISCFVEALSYYTLESKNGALVALKTQDKSDPDGTRRVQWRCA